MSCWPSIRRSSRVFHSISDRSGIYDHVLKEDGGHGCLLSFVLKDTGEGSGGV